MTRIVTDGTITDVLCLRECQPGAAILLPVLQDKLEQSLLSHAAMN